MKTFKQYLKEADMSGEHHIITDDPNDEGYVIKKPKSPDVWFNNGKPTDVFSKLQIMKKHPDIFAKIAELTPEYAKIQKLSYRPNIEIIMNILQDILDEEETNDFDYISDWMANLLSGPIGDSPLDDEEWVLGYLDHVIDEESDYYDSKDMILKYTNAFIDYRNQIKSIISEFKGMELDIHFGNLGMAGGKLKAFDI